MKRLLLYGLPFILLSSFVQSDEEVIYPPFYHDSFSPGETIEYRLFFSIFTVGKAKSIIRNEIYTINGRPSYKIDVFGKTSGLIDWIAQVDDQFGAYLDTASLLPHQSYRNLKEGRYRRNEIVRYDHRTRMIEVKELDQETRKFKEPEYFYSPKRYMFDMFGGLMIMRSVDFDKMQVNDTISTDAFLEDTFYTFKTVYRGKEVIKTKLGKFRAIVLAPIMPDNDLFEEGEDAIKVWLSDDKNKIPLAVKAEMFIGHAGFEILSFSGLKNPVSSYVQ